MLPALRMRRDYINGDESPEMWHSVPRMKEDRDSRIPGYLFVLASLFHEGSPVEEGVDVLRI